MLHNGNLFGCITRTYSCREGYRHNGSCPPWASGSKQGIEEGGTVGLLLRRGSLSVHIGGREVGVMCTGLTGPLSGLPTCTAAACASRASRRQRKSGRPS